uniref:HMG box domain-containing protein n=1 Tax=Glossina palpalis gambiensis TaxID=67801 RepID=A0A1B0C361_9MUSC
MELKRLSIWNKITKAIACLVNAMKRKTRVTASPSTLRREYQRQTGYAASSNPIFNFYYGVGRKVCASRGDLWKTMSDDEKESYRTMAKEEKRLKRLRRNVCVKA